VEPLLELASLSADFLNEIRREFSI